MCITNGAVEATYDLEDARHSRIIFLYFRQRMENEGAAMTERGNEILAALPGAAMAALQPHLTPVTFAPGNTVQQVGELIDHVYFPTVGIASLQIMMSDGRA